MAKDPVCGMDVDESKTQYIQKLMDKKYIYVENNAKKNLTKIRKSMDTNSKENY